MTEFDPRELLGGTEGDRPSPDFVASLRSQLEAELDESAGEDDSPVAVDSSSVVLVADAPRSEEKATRWWRTFGWLGAVAAVVAVVVGVSVVLTQDEEGAPAVETDDPVEEPVAPTVPPTTTSAAPTTTTPLDPADFEVGEIFPRRSFSGPDGELWERTGATTRSRLDPVTMEVVESYSVPADTVGLGVGDAGIWVRSGTDNSLSRLDPATGEVLGTVQLQPGDLNGPSVGADAVWILRRDAGTVTRIDPETFTVVAVIDVGEFPWLLYDRDEGVWIDRPVGGDDETRGEVVRIDPQTNTVSARVEVPPQPAAFNVGHGAVWARGTVGFGVPMVRVDPVTNAVVAEIDFGEDAVGGSGIGIGVESVWHTHIDATDQQVFYRLSRIDPQTNTVIATIDLGRLFVDIEAGGLFVTENAVWVSNSHESVDGWIRVDVPAGT